VLLTFFIENMEEYVKKNLISTNTASEIFYTHMNVSLNMKKKHGIIFATNIIFLNYIITEKIVTNEIKSNLIQYLQIQS
jgi:hypothetical protein